MPKLNNRNPKMGKLKSYAVVRFGGKIHYLGKHGTPEALSAYNRFCAELQSNPDGHIAPVGEQNVTVKELAAAFLDHSQEVHNPINYRHYRIVLSDFLVPLYGDNVSVANFTPKALKLVRESMIQSGRYCRKHINSYVGRIVAVFRWGVSEELVAETTWRALTSVKALRKGEKGTRDNPEREPVALETIQKTLQFAPPTLRAMALIHYMTGMRPEELVMMTVGNIDRSKKNGLWYYTPAHHKTEEHIGEKPYPLGKPEQELLEPYLIDKKPENSIFSPRTAMEERNAEKRAKRKSKVTPSQAARDKINAKNPSTQGEFYTVASYRRAIKYAITKGNKAGVEIPHWFPYMLRHAAATAIEESDGLDAAQAQLGHTTANMTKRYSKAALKTREKLAKNRRNPFDTDGQDKDVA